MVTTRTYVCLAAWLAIALPARAQLAPGALLKPGMQLSYEAEGKRSAPWVVESVQLDVPFEGRDPSSFVAIRKDGPSSPAEEQRLARERGILFEHGNQGWAASRPVRPGLVVEKKNTEGRVVGRFRAHALALESIGGMLIPVVHTTLEFLNPHGQPARRLRERYAIGLATATGGVFETADPAAPGGFKPTLRFRLVAISWAAPPAGTAAGRRSPRSASGASPRSAPGR